MKMQPSTLLFFVLWLPSVIEAAQILAFFPVPIKSHQLVFQPLLKGLAEKGHQITYITGIGMSEKVANIKEILIGNVFEEDLSDNQLAADPYSFRHLSAFHLAAFHWNFGVVMTEKILEKPIVQEFIKQRNTKFDVIIAEILFSQEAFIGLGSVFDAPVIDFSSQCGTHYVHDVLYNPTLFSYIPDYRVSFSDRMNLGERLLNTISGLYQIYGSYWYFFPRQEQILYSNFNLSSSSENRPSLKHLLQTKIAASIFNSDPVIGYPRPFFPQSIEVGGISLRPGKPLPKDLQRFMDEAKSGVVYFSFGSILAAENMPQTQKKHFVEAFKRLKQKVLWKYEGALDFELPKNVLVQKWLPQGDVLAHPNCRVFITHCGYLSLVETVDAAVPIIGVPFFADQPRNCRMAQEKGFGVHLNFDDLTPELIVDSIQSVLTNKSYSENAKKISRVFKDQMVSPVDKAVFLVEYVMRHGGNPNSETGAKDLWWFQYFLVDVAAVIISVILIFFLIVYYAFKFLFTLLFSKLRGSSKPSAKPRNKKGGKKNN